jgi:hypothetical protein
MRFVIALLAIAGLVVSVLALKVHNMDPAAAPPCAVSEHWDCGAVNHSRFAVFPPRSFDEAPNAKGHLPVAIAGIAGYGLIALRAAVDCAAPGGVRLHVRLLPELPGGVCNGEVVHLLRLVARINDGNPAADGDCGRAETARGPAEHLCLTGEGGTG